jgi:hypothetical protein
MTFRRAHSLALRLTFAGDAVTIPVEVVRIRPLIEKWPGHVTGAIATSTFTVDIAADRYAMAFVVRVAFEWLVPIGPLRPCINQTTQLEGYETSQSQWAYQHSKERFHSPWHSLLT